MSTAIGEDGSSGGAPVGELDDVPRTDDSVAFAYQRLRREILTGHLPAGATLAQVQLARALGISRTPLREALSRLVAENLVVGDFNQRMRVSDLNLDDFDQIYAMRIALEPLGVAVTIPALSDAGRAALTAQVEGMEEAARALDLDRFRAEHRMFHLGLTAASGPRMTRALADLWDHSERYRLAYLHHDYADPGSASADRLQTSQGEHRVILQAAVRGDPTACSAALVRHLRRTLDVVFDEVAPAPRPRMAVKAFHSSSSWTGRHNQPASEDLRTGGIDDQTIAQCAAADAVQARRRSP